MDRLLGDRSQRDGSGLFVMRDPMTVRAQHATLRDLSKSGGPAATSDQLADSGHLLIASSVVKIKNAMIVDATPFAAPFSLDLRDLMATFIPRSSLHFSMSFRMSRSPLCSPLSARHSGPILQPEANVTWPTTLRGWTYRASAIETSRRHSTMPPSTVQLH